MSDYIIASASTADLPDTYYEEHHIPCIRYPYTIRDFYSNGITEYEDDCKESSREKAYLNMRKGFEYATSMINTAEYADFFRDLLRQGKDVLYLDMSKEMSSSYQASHQAAEIVQAEYPDHQLYLMDTRCISGGLGLLVRECVRRKESGMSFAEVVQWGEENKLRIMHRFTVDDLKYLKRSGRVSNTSAIIGAMLNIKPVLYVPDDGKLTVSRKVRGRKAAMRELVEGIKRDMCSPDGQTAIINHADCLADAEWLRLEMLNAFPNMKDVLISNLGVIIGAHCGPGLLTVFYFGDQRKP